MNPFSTFKNFLIANMDCHTWYSDSCLWTVRPGFHGPAIRRGSPAGIDIPKGSLIYVTKFSQQMCHFGIVTPECRSMRGGFHFRLIEDSFFSVTDIVNEKWNVQSKISPIARGTVLRYFEEGSKEALYQLSVGADMCDPQAPYISMQGIEKCLRIYESYEGTQDDFFPFATFPDHPLKDVSVSLDVLYLSGWLDRAVWDHKRYTLRYIDQDDKPTSIVPFHNGYLSAHIVKKIGPATVAKQYFNNLEKKSK